MKYLWRWFARALLVAIAAVVVYEFWIFGHVVWWVWFNPSTSAFMEDRLEVLQERNPDAELRHKWVPYNRISIHLKRALIAAEDAKFLDHDGFDWEAIQKAYEKNLKKGKVVAGGSTISQQLAKNLFLSGRRTPWRKAQEALITVMIEHTMSKQRIFEIYLNIIEWGNGVFGAEAAARYYYKTSAANLTAGQAARLAAMVPKPRFYDRVRATPLLERRTWIILDRMGDAQVP
jgi:monofunctional biosynthetic peptidoglycan transglycosylase